MSDALIETANQGGVVLSVVERLGRAVNLEVADVLFGRVEFGVDHRQQQAALVFAQREPVLVGVTPAPDQNPKGRVWNNRITTHTATPAAMRSATAMSRQPIPSTDTPWPRLPDSRHRSAALPLGLTTGNSVTPPACATLSGDVLTIVGARPRQNGQSVGVL